MSVKKQLRHAHCEGHLDICHDETGDYIITCGPDGDVRIYHGFDDDEPISHRIGDVVYFVAYKNGKFYTASDDNAVSAFTFKDGQSDGIVARFTAPATHFCFNSSGSTIVAGASDFVVKIVDIATSSQKVLMGHEAPILSVALDPKELFVASSSCDGTVRVWNLGDQKPVKTLSVLAKSNDFSTSKTLCRLTWDKNGKYLFVPVNKKIVAYDAQTWDSAFELADVSITEGISVTCLSPCGLYLAGATTNGNLLVWDLRDKKCVFREKHEKSFAITGLSWHPQLSRIIYCDNQGYFGVSNNVVPVKNTEENSDLFDDKDDNLLMEAAFDGDEVDDEDDVNSGAIPGIDTDVDDDIDEDDTASVPPVAKPASTEDDNLSVAGNAFLTESAASTELTSIVKGIVPLQQPFQSSSSPVGLSARFMVWNSVGFIIQYNSEEEQSINVEFHDTATHHSIHVNNTLGHSLADVSSSAALIACEGDENTPSQLVCMHFGSWDNCKEWSTSMPEGEDIQALCLGDDWLAVGTDRRLIRVFSICGTQKHIMSLPGPIVTMAGHNDLLLVAYHNGLGVPGDQCLSFQLFSVSNNSRVVDRLPLSPKSTLAWLRFSEAGTPFSADSAGIVRMFNRGFNCTWVEVANLRKYCKGKTDNMWLVGVNESQLHMRAVMCKGSKYPPVLPRPTVQLLPFELPLCELSTDKGSLESTMMQTKLFSGGDAYGRPKSQSDVALQESLMKLFALACKSGREARATELCQMMPSSRTVQLAIKYASRLHLIQLADRLGDIARQKSNEEEAELEQIDSQIRLSMVNSTPRYYRSQNEEVQHDMRATHVEVEEDVEDESSKQVDTPRGLLLMRKKDEKDITPKSLSDSQAEKRNPFKVAGIKAVSTTTPAQVKGTSVFDSMEKQKPGRISFSAAKSSASDTVEVAQGGKKMMKNSSQSKLSDITKKQNLTKPAKSELPPFDVWFEENRETLTQEHEDCDGDEQELTVKAMSKYRQLIKVSRVAPVAETDDRKRKRGLGVDEEQASTVKKLPDRLSSFMFNKNS